MVDVTNPEALGWKHDYEPGIITADGKLVGWPDSLGAMPAQADVDRWEAEYAVFIDDPANDPTDAEVILLALKAKGTLTEGDIIAAKRSRPPRARNNP